MNTPYFLGIIGNMGPAADEYFQRCVREAVNIDGGAEKSGDCRPRRDTHMQ